MTRTSPLRVLVSDLLRDRRRRHETFDAPIPIELELSRVDGPVSAELDLDGVSGGVMVAGTARAEATHTCYRCLTTWSEAVEVQVGQLVGDGGDYDLDGDHLDLEPVVRDELSLALPLLPLCREDCLGLCATCGADLNGDTCPGHDDESDSPFAALRDLLEP